MLSNPYIAGNPVQGQERFIGRQDVLYDVEQTLRNPNANAIVLFGQRRIGKTSVLLQIEQELAAKEEFTPIYFDLQDKAALPLGDVLYQMAQVVAQITNIALPERRKFDSHGRYFREIFMPQAAQHCHNQGLALLLDEFDVLDMPQREQARVAFFPYLRDWMRVAEGLQFVFVLGRRPEELSTDTLSTFKGIRARRVSLMDEDDTEAIIRQSERNRSVRWNDEAVARVWHWTQGHPYFTQLLCSEVWESAIAPEGFNGFENGDGDDADARELPVVTEEDVDAALEGTLDQGANALQWIWTGLPPAERIIMAAMAEASAEQISQEELTETLNRSKVRLILRDLELAPETLISWDLLRMVATGRYRFAIPLLRRWVAAEKPLRRVKADLDSIEPLAESLYQSAEGFYKLNQLDKAEDALRNALDINPYHFKARLRLSEVLLAKGDPAGAVKELEPAYEFDPRSSGSSLVRALLALSDAQEAEPEQLVIYDRILTIDPDQQIALEKKRGLQRQQAEKAAQAGDIDAALQLYEAIGDADSTQRVKAIQRQREFDRLTSEAARHEAAEDWLKAIEIYNRLLEFAPEDGPWAEKLSAAQQQKRLAETYTRAITAVEQGKNDLAQHLFGEILGVQPDYKDAWRYLGMTVKHVDVARLTEENQQFAAQITALQARLAQSVKRKVAQVLGGGLAAVIVLAVFISWGLANLYYQKGVDDGKLSMLIPTPEPIATVAPTVALPTATPTKTPTPSPTPTFTPSPTITPTPDKIAQFLAEADNYFKRDRLTSPAGQNAFESYQQVLALEPTNQPARDGLLAIMAKYRAWGDDSDQRGDYEKARAHYEKYLLVADYLLKLTGDQSVKASYQSVQAKYAKLIATPTPTPTMTPTMTPTPSPLPVGEGPGVGLQPDQISCVNAQEGQPCVDPVTGMEFVWILGGTFEMGCLAGDTGCDRDEKPAHTVTLNGFWMGKYEVTQAQWQNVMDENPAFFNESRVGKEWPNHPVEQVSWNDVQEFITELNQKAGKTIYRLPSEAEWEYACRAGTTTPFFFGDTISTEQANYAVDRKQTTPVGSFPKNAFGLYDMHGNVWEWVADTYHDSYTGAPDDGSVRGKLDDRKAKVLRGGSWLTYPAYVRSAYRDDDAPAYRNGSIGVRVVRGR